MLLSNYLFGLSPSSVSVLGHVYFISLFHSVQLTAQLIKQQEQATGQGPFLFFGLPFHLAVGDIALFLFQVLATGNGDASLLADIPHQDVEPVHALP